MAPSLKSALLGGLLLPLVAAQGCPYANLHKKDTTLVERADGDSSQETLDTSFGKCPAISDAAGAGTLSRDWWPCQLRLDVLRQFAAEQNPLGDDFDYAAEFSKLDCKPLPPRMTVNNVTRQSLLWESHVSASGRLTGVARAQMRDSRPTSESS